MNLKKQKLGWPSSSLSDNYIQEFFEFWRKIRCPKCEAVNWMYDSHSQRNYPYIPNGCECHKCSNRFFVGDRGEFDARYSYEIEESGLEKALEDYLDCMRGEPNPS